MCVEMVPGMRLAFAEAERKRETSLESARVVYWRAVPWFGFDLVFCMLFGCEPRGCEGCVSEARSEMESCFS